MPLIATLISDPSKKAIMAKLANSAAHAVGAETYTWLGKEIACDIALPDSMDRKTAEVALRRIVDIAPVDIVVQEKTGRRKKALIADMDSTMIDQECIDELAAEAGLREQVSSITARAMRGEIEFESALRERVFLLKGLSVSVIAKVLDERITLAAGGKALIDTMKAHGAYTALVSGGFTRFTEVISQALGFDEHSANILEEKDGILTGEVRTPILGRQAKVARLKSVGASRELSASDFIAVGDGANDLGMLKLAGSGVALHAKPVVAEQARIRIDHGDLTALLYLQGYRRDEFIS